MDKELGYCIQVKVGYDKTKTSDEIEKSIKDGIKIQAKDAGLTDEELPEVLKLPSTPSPAYVHYCLINFGENIKAYSKFNSYIGKQKKD